MLYKFGKDRCKIVAVRGLSFRTVGRTDGWTDADCFCIPPSRCWQGIKIPEEWIWRFNNTNGIVFILKYINWNLGPLDPVDNCPVVIAGGHLVSDYFRSKTTEPLFQIKPFFSFPWVVPIELYSLIHCLLLKGSLKENFHPTLKTFQYWTSKFTLTTRGPEGPNGRVAWSVTRFHNT